MLTAEIRPQIGGIVTRRLFEEGAYVRAGEALFAVDDRLYASAAAEAAAELEGARAAQAAADAKAARFATLRNTNAASLQDVDDAITSARQAAALVNQREAEVATARANLEYTRIRSPIAGRIGRSLITVGGLVTPGQAAPLAIVQSIGVVFADLALPLGQMDGGRLDTRAPAPPPDGAAVKIFVGGDQARPLTGRILFTDAAVAQSTQSTIVRVRVDNPQHRLLPGMFVRGEIEEPVAPLATLIPQQAVRLGDNASGSVLILDRQNRARRREVILGPAQGDMWIIRSGLSRGERVVVTGADKISPGQAVQPQPFVESGANP